MLKDRKKEKQVRQPRIFKPDGNRELYYPAILMFSPERTTGLKLDTGIDSR
jgi:hypothetical protein